MQLSFSKMVVFGFIILVIIVLLAVYSFNLTKDALKDYNEQETYERFKISSMEEDSSFNE